MFSRLVVSLVLRMAWLNLNVSSAAVYSSRQPLGRWAVWNQGERWQGASSTPTDQSRAGRQAAV